MAGMGRMIDLWDPSCSEARKRVAVVDAIAFHRGKMTPASLRTVLDRINPLIELVEWFADRETLDPFTFRLEMPLAGAKRCHLRRSSGGPDPARHSAGKAGPRPYSSRIHVRAHAQALRLSAARVGRMARLDTEVDIISVTQPQWATYLQTALGESILTATPDFMEACRH